MCSHIQVLIGQQAYLTHRPKRRSIEILIENETNEQMKNERAQHVKEMGFDYVYW
jgi:hypothetical protein